MIYRIDIRPHAIEDIEEIVDYIEYELFSPMAAQRFLDGLDTKINSLRLHANVFAISTYKDVLKYDVFARHVIYKEFAVIYSIHGNWVVVHRVIHGSLIKG